MSDVLKKVSEIGILPVLTIDHEKRALPLAKALKDGGIPLMEVMFRSEAAAKSIKLISENMPDFIVGAGTILTVEQAQQAIDSGAKFLVSPGFNPKVVAFAVDKKIPIVPGCVTPTEVEAAREFGLHVLKFFPAIQQGGVPAMGLLGGPYKDVQFVPTGDLTQPIAEEYLSFRRIDAAGGDYMLSYDDIHNDRYESITKSVSKSVQSYLALHLVKVASQGLGCCCSSSCCVLDALFEDGADKVIYIGSRDGRRAYHYLKRKGVEFDENKVAFNDDGSLKQAVFKDKKGDFTVCLIED